MKSFKSFILESKKKEEISSIPHPIHFKHTSHEEHDKQLEEIALNWFKPKPKAPLPPKTTLPPKKSLPPVSNFLEQNLNSHLGSTPDEITKSLHSDQTKMDSTSHHALLKYSGSGSHEMNQHLVSSNGILHKNHLKLADGIDQAIQKHKIKKELHTYSGVSFDPRNHLNKKKEMRSPAYISTTHDPKVAYGFSSKGKLPERHIIHLHLKPGDPAVHMGDHSVYEEENETVLGRGAVLQHHGTTEYQDKSGKCIIHHMTINRTPEQNSLYSKIKGRKNETIH